MAFSPSYFSSVIDGYLPEPHSSLLNGILFGMELKTAKYFINEIKVVGLLHLVVLSGANITMIAAITGYLTRIFSKRISLLITILTIILFTIFVGPKAPIVRAAIMGSFTYVAILTGRKSVTIYSLFLSLLIILLIRPAWMATISLWLSYAATFGIILFSGTNSKQPIIKELKTSLAAQVFTAPIIFICFKQISFISPLSNLLVAPVIPFLMIFGFLTGVLGKIDYFLGLIPSFVCYGLLTYVIWVIHWLSQIPGAFRQF